MYDDSVSPHGSEKLMPSLDETRERQTVSLDGQWQFAHASDGLWRSAVVPMPWQASFADLRQMSGRATYRRQFARPEGASGRVAVLRFGAVSYLAEVRVNGQEVGRHEGGYLPFDCVIPAGLLRDMNDVEVLCILPDGDPATADGISFAEIPHGKQSWYGPIGGIWQSVTLELRNPAHVEHVAITADLATGQVVVKLALSSGAASLTIIAPDGGVVGEGPASGTTTLTVPSVQAWSPDAPNLYTLRVDVTDGVAIDSTTHMFGFRSIETRDGQILLNGQPFYMRAALDQDWR